MHACQGLVFQCADEVGFGLLPFEVEKFLVPRSASRSEQPYSESSRALLDKQQTFKVLFSGSTSAVASYYFLSPAKLPDR